MFLKFAVGVAAVLAVAAPAQASEQRTETAAPQAAEQSADLRKTVKRPKFQMPFTCNQKWYAEASTSDHNPALDFWMGDHNTNKPSTKGQWVRASASGKVVLSYKDSQAGHVVQIRHTFKTGKDWFTTYLHLKKRDVKKGQTVPMGKKIGEVGRSGPTANGVYHLHYEQAASYGKTADWGNRGAPRKAVKFNNKTYTGVGESWQIRSRNTGAQDSCGT
ncbi:M23 family metallopeptidase [Nonomuraea sp. NPDC050394]|uniref:M23 family metallopeptidase n=1 Tax=Nonomuraea sp. NPDC050394 TaxID=3364363 RepID=UPI0037B3474D